MFVSSHTPEVLSPQELDRFLEAGWFRMGQHIFTTNFLNFGNKFYSAFWLRLPLKDYTGDSTFEKLKKRNASFVVIIQPATITPEKEELFLRYKDSVSFQTSSSLRELLFSKGDRSAYNTYEVLVNDGEKLIGVGYFDLGHTSAAGISSFYDPAYKKYSLGKYMIYRKIEFCKALHLTHFYPGYVVPGYSAFDYKLTIGSKQLQYLDLITNTWYSADQLPVITPLNLMEQKLTELQQLFLQHGVPCQVTYYEFFDVALITELRDIGVLEYPIFLSWADVNENNFVTLIAYDVVSGTYKLLRNYAVWKSELERENPSIYNTHMLRPLGEVMESTKPEGIINKLLQVNKQEKV